MSDTTPIRVLLVDTEFNTHNRYLALSIRDALARHGSVGEVILADYSNVVRHAQTGVFDLFLAFGGGGGGSDHVILHRAASFCRFRMLWTTDDPYTVEENVEVSVGYDLVATNDFASIGRYDRAMHLPLAAAPEWCWHEVQNDQKDILYDVLFLGNPWPNRVNVLSKLVSALGDEMRFKIGLPSNEFIPSYELPGFDGAETNWRASLIDFCRFANRSKVVLTLPRSFTASRGGQPSAVTPGPRLFETALAGTCQLIQQSGEDVSRYFNPDTEIATFSDPEEGIESLRRLVKNPDLRHTMAKSSQMKALSNHTYDHRVNSLISAMTEWQRQNPVCLSSSPLQNSTAQNKEPERSITRNILFVTHNMVGHSNWGGVEIYQQQMADELKLHKFATYILFPRSDQAGRQYLSLIAPDGTQTDFETSPQNYSRYIRFPQHELIFANILSDFDIELVHMQHLINHVMGLPIIARAFGVPVVYTLHDYYIMCDDPGLFGYDEQHCYIYDRSAEQCEICLPAMRGVPAASQTRRKKAMRRSLAAIDAFIASTPRSLEHVLSFYPEIKQRSSIIPMAFQGTNAHIDTRRSMPSTVNEGTLRVLIPGNFTKHKGARALITMMRSLASEDIYFRVIGRVDEPFKTEVHELNLPNAEFVGPYRQEEFALLAEGFDVSIHYSVWPETYCITLSESLSAGLVPIVSDIGAFSDRIQHGENGLTVQVGDVGAIARHLRALAADRTRLDELRRGHDAAHLCSVRDHASALALLYNNLLDRFPAHGRSKGEPQLSRAVRLTVEKVDPQQVNHPRWDTDEIIWERAPPAPLNVKLLERGATPLSGRAKYVISRFCGLEMPTQHARVTICDGQRFSIEGELRDFSRAERVSAEIEFEGITVIRVGCSLVRNSTATFLFTLDAATRALPEGDYSLRLVICADERTVVTDLELNVTIAHALQPRPVRFDRTGSPLSVRKGARIGVGWDALQLDDGFLQETSSSIAIRGRKIFVRGWAVDISTARRVRRYYLSFFDNRTGDEYIVSCEPRHRPDILNLYGSKEFEFSGFEFSLEGNVLPEGEYSLSLLGRVGDGLVEWDSGRRFEVLDAVMSFPSPVSQGKEYASFATSKILPDILTVCGHLAQAPGDMFVAERYLEVAGEWPLSQGQDSWPSIEILLEGAQSWLARAERRFRMSKTRTKVGSIRFSAVIPVARLPIETFALRIIVRNGEHREVTPILCRVSGSAGVVSDGVHFLDGRAATDDLLACGCLDVFGPHTSVGLPLEDKGLEVASGEIDIRGWIDLKVPDAEIASKRLHLLVSSADGRRVATAWLHRVARHDVYDILNKDETSVIGFEGRMHLPADFQSAELTLVVGGGLAAVKLPLVTSARLSTRLASRMG